MPLGADTLSAWVVASGLISAFVVVRHWRQGRSLGLLLTYVLCFAALHWLAPLMHLLPWFEPLRGDLTPEGLRQSTFAIAGFAIGAELAGLWMQRGRFGRPGELRHLGSSRRVIDAYLVVGLGLYASSLLGARLPLGDAVVSTGATLVAMSVGIKAWDAWLAGRYSVMVLWLSTTVIFPIVTVLVQGFLGYGFVAALIVLSLVGSLVPHRQRTVAVGALMLYLGLSVYVTYMRDRADIRELVWGGEAVDRRVSQLTNTFANAEWFDPRNIDHLRRIDKRLNQDHLVGAAVVYLRDGYVPYANGQTLLDAVIAIIPRAVWPDKPVVGGSGELVATYTGIRFSFGTSVGVGQVMEMHVNFGSVGVLLGFVSIGLLVALIDRKAARRFAAGDLRMFAVWYLPGLSLLQVGGSLAEVAATGVASAALVAGLNYLMRRSLSVDAPQATPALPASSVPDARRRTEVTP